MCVYHENQMYKAQYAFNMSMIMCPAVHMATRSLLRSSSTHEPSDPLSRVKFYISHTQQIVYISSSNHNAHMRERENIKFT